MPRRNNATLEDVEIGFLNFAGRETEFNRQGDRNFSVFLAPEQASAMEADGWNVKYLKVREEGDEAQAYLQVSVSYNPKAKPPKIVMITSRGPTILPEWAVENLDFVDIKQCDVTLNPYEWAVRDKSGIKAYLATMYITIHEDPLDVKYAELMEKHGAKQIESGWDGNIVEGEVVEDQRAIGG